MRRTRSVTAAAGCCLLFISVGCGGSGSPGPAASAPSRVAQGLIALGHSGLTGAATDPGDISIDVRANSWATGTNPEVHSIYTRLVAVDPGFKGHAENAALDGSTADQLDGEITTALTSVPRPRLAIVQDIGNDIRCDGADATRYQGVGTTLQRALERLVKASPDIVIVAVPFLGRPVWRARALLENEIATVHGEGTGPCSLLTPAGALNRSGIRAFTRIVNGFDAALLRACRAVSQCVYADAAGTFVDHARLLAQDWNHLNPAGQARFAKLLWPTVARSLSLTP